MINDLLDMAKIEAGEMKLDAAHVNLSVISRDVFKLVQGLAYKSKVTVVDDIAPETTVWADGRAVKHILLNLISNAIKFAPGGHVTISAVTDNGQVRLVVSDNGIGMSPEEIVLAVTPFKQIESQVSSQHRGTGLGLPLVKRLAEQHGGRMEIQSAKGRGTTVSVILPDAVTKSHKGAGSAQGIAA